ncbi:MAG: BtpA/SgcQ family protein [Chloroflexi bacterium]|nr:BtpA/SgcQ family protein [Anaerolineaceae bacterium]NMB90672.1 BtpA/SgcQ family protein [Chloroflexota bacterium]
MRQAFAELFGSQKYIIAAVHFLPLPGSPAYDREGGMKKIIQRAKRDTKILVESGVQTLLFTNEADMPYVQRMPQEGLAAFTAVTQEVMHAYSLPFGVNVLIDAMAGFTVAHATGASFIRGLFSGCYATDMGFIESQGPAIFRARANLGVRLPYFVHNLSSILGPQLLERSPEAEAKSVLSNVPVDGFTLPARPAGEFSQVRAATAGYPLVIGSGINFDNALAMLEQSDGAVVATCLREDTKLLNPVDADRAEKFMRLVRPIIGA